MIIDILSKKGAKRPPARLSGLPLPLTMTVLCTFYHAGVRNVYYSGFSDFHTERKKNLFEKMGIWGGSGGGVKRDSRFQGIFFPPVP
jgi:hypothetical protein